jgi:TolB protein
MAGASLSADGKHVCYIAYPQQAYDGVLYRAPLDGSAEPKVIYSGRIGWDPAWSPDGSQILFWMLEDNGERRLAVVDADGKDQPKKLANQEGSRYNTDAEWSPDGKRIIFSSDREFAAK